MPGVPDRLLVAYSDGPTAPRLSPAGVIAAAGLDGPAEVLLGLTVERHPWLDDPGLRRAVRAGRSDGWLARRRFLRRLRGSEPRRPVPTSAERSPAGALARDQRYASWQ